MSRAERPRSAEIVEHRDAGARGRDRAVNLQTILVARLFDGVMQRLFEVGAKCRELVGRDCHAGCHRVAATLDEQAGSDRLAYCAADIDACDRASRSRADPAALQRNCKCGPAITLL